MYAANLLIIYMYMLSDLIWCVWPPYKYYIIESLNFYFSVHLLDCFCSLKALPFVKQFETAVLNSIADVPFVGETLLCSNTQHNTDAKKLTRNWTNKIINRINFDHFYKKKTPNRLRYSSNITKYHVQI